jgi:hypothetical protein
MSQAVLLRWGKQKIAETGMRNDMRNKHRAGNP